MDSDIHYEGWLIKSPPTKRIWRARWRRRYFALKQGELPGQYLLEYYTDQTCRKLKGIIDLDQCEQVDAGLFMERKFPHVFNVKTPHRTYYLAADSDDVMRYWVNCICNVCGLQDLSKLPVEEGGLAPESPPQALEQSLSVDGVSVASLVVRPANLPDSSSASERTLQAGVANEERMYMNNDFAQRVLREKGSPETSPTNSHRVNTAPEGVSSPSTKSIATNRSPLRRVEQEDTAEHDYYNDVSMTSQADRSTRKRPDNLKLSDGSATPNETAEPSPALSTSSGPYIPICECFSGSPVLANPQMRRNGPSSFASYENHFAPLNSLSRNNALNSPLNIGQLNLTEGPASAQAPAEGGRSSDESESVFTDDDEASSNSGSQAGVASHTAPLTETEMRRLRPSDSSIENENIGWTAMQRFSKIPTEEKKCLNSNDPPPRPPKRVNESAVIGPLDSSSCVVEERYEIPRSHRNPHQSSVATPGLPIDGTANSASIQRRSHFYTNAAPSNLEGQVFRYDFSEVAMPPPAINRNLKPKQTMMQMPSRSCDQIETPLVQGANPRNSLFLAGCRQSLQMTPSRSDDKLQYLDLDHTNGGAPEPAIRNNIGAASAHNILVTAHTHMSTMPSIKHSISEHNSITGPFRWAATSSTASIAATPGTSSRDNSGRGIVYKTVDFVKTDAFNRTRQDAEMNRASNKDK